MKTAITLSATIEIDCELCHVGATWTGGEFEDMFAFNDSGYELPQEVVDANEDVITHALIKAKWQADQASQLFNAGL